MSRDYKPAAARSKPSSSGSGGSLFAGILIGLVIGLAIAVGVAWYLINKGPNSFLPRSKAPDTPAQGKGEGVKGMPQEAAKSDDRQGKATDKPRFEFYDILKGEERPAGKDGKDAVQPPKADPHKETFFLQAGAFQGAPDADNLKARLALLGVEASIQTITIPDKGVLHRVRVGPFSNVEELNRVRDNLMQNGVKTDLVKVGTTP